MSQSLLPVAVNWRPVNITPASATPAFLKNNLREHSADGLCFFMSPFRCLEMDSLLVGDCRQETNPVDEAVRASSGRTTSCVYQDQVLVRDMMTSFNLPCSLLQLFVIQP
ncbi:MAG: hypothetical protein NTY01_16760, partial [Verrucomicrobia bacterium]|nr:hypothetical protein [Verrucomicrobiota bacterium]